MCISIERKEGKTKAEILVLENTYALQRDLDDIKGDIHASDKFVDSISNANTLAELRDIQSAILLDMIS